MQPGSGPIVPWKMFSNFFSFFFLMACEVLFFSGFMGFVGKTLCVSSEGRCFVLVGCVHYVYVEFVY